MRGTNIEAWLSLVERYIRDVEVASSNLVASIGKESENLEFAGFLLFSFCVYDGADGHGKAKK